MADGNTLLHWTAKLDLKGLVTDICDAKADITLKNRDNIAPIKLAALSGSWAAVSSIATTKTKDPNDDAQFGSAFVCAVANRHLAVAKALLKCEARVNCLEEKSSHHPLYYVIKAACEDKVELRPIYLKLAQEIIAKKNGQEIGEKPAFQLAIEKVNYDAIRLLANNCIDVISALSDAVLELLKVNIQFAVQLLGEIYQPPLQQQESKEEKGAEEEAAIPRQATKQSWDALLAILKKIKPAVHEKVYQQLAATFLKTNAAALISANQTTILSALLTPEIVAQFCDHDGNTLLHLTARARQPDLVKIITRLGGDPNFTNDDSATPLIAMMQNTEQKEVTDEGVKIFLLLLTHKQAGWAYRCYGKNFLEIGCENKHPIICRLFNDTEFRWNVFIRFANVM